VQNGNGLVNNFELTRYFVMFVVWINFGYQNGSDIVNKSEISKILVLTQVGLILAGFCKRREIFEVRCVLQFRRLGSWCCLAGKHTSVLHLWFGHAGSWLISRASRCRNSRWYRDSRWSMESSCLHYRWNDVRNIQDQKFTHLFRNKVSKETKRELYSFVSKCNKT
jgi:hypothetical protein